MIKCQLKHSFLLPLLELDPINNVFYLQSAEHVPTDNAFTLSPTYWCQYWYWYWCQTQNGRNRISQVSPGHQCMSNDSLYVCYKIKAKYTLKYWKEFYGYLVKIVLLAEKSCPVAFFVNHVIPAAAVAPELILWRANERIILRLGDPPA